MVSYTRSWRSARSPPRDGGSEASPRRPGRRARLSVYDLRWMRGPSSGKTWLATSPTRPVAPRGPARDGLAGREGANGRGREPPLRGCAPSPSPIPRVSSLHRDQRRGGHVRRALAQGGRGHRAGGENRRRITGKLALTGNPSP